MEQQDQQPDVTKDHATCFSHGEGPRYSRHAVFRDRETPSINSTPKRKKKKTCSSKPVLPPVEENIRQRRVCAHVWHPLVHNDHDEGSEPKHKHHVDGAQNSLPVLGIQPPCLLLVLSVGVLVILLTHRRRVSAVAVPARVAIAEPVQTASRPCGRVAIKGETQLLQQVYVLFLEFADGEHEAFNVPEHLELQRRRTEVVLAEGEQTGAIKPMFVAQQVHIITEALFFQPLGDVFGSPATDTEVCHFHLNLKAAE